MITSYIVVPFLLGARGKLKPGRPQTEKDQVRAVRAAERIGVRSAGVIVLQQEADPANDVYAEPRLIFRRGDVPPELVEQLGA